MKKVLIFIVAIQLNGVYAQVMQNGVSAPQTEKKEEVPSTSSSKKENSAVRDEQLKSSTSEVQQIESAVSTYSVSHNAAKQSRTSRTPSTYYQSQMDNSVDVLESVAPNSFEFHLYTYVAGNYNVNLVDHLVKAEKMQPTNTDVLMQKVAYHLIKGESSQTLTYLEKLVKNKKIGSDVINYGYDLLQSVPQNGVLITHGFDDTYAAVYEQLKNKIRTDVTVISLDLLQSDYYRKELKSKLINLPDRKTVDVEYLKNFVQLNDKLNLTISATVPKEYLTGISSKLFITGLVFTYTNDSDFDNYSRNKELWANDLKKSLVNNPQTDKGKQLSLNYLPMLLQLANSGSLLKQDVSEIDKVINKIAKQTNKTEQVNKLKTY